MEKSNSEPVCTKTNKKKCNRRNKKCSDTNITSSEPKNSSEKNTCCICHKVPRNSRKYYGHLFCIACFHKYIWSAPANGDVKSFSFDDLAKLTDQIMQ